MYRLSHEYDHYFIALILSETPTTPHLRWSNLKRSCIHNCPSSMDEHGSPYVCILLYHFIPPYVHMQKKNNMLMVPKQMAPRCNLKEFSK